MEDKKKYIIYKGTKYTLREGYYKTTVALHRRIWEDNYGEVPPDHHIHHINGDSTDNRLENLECIHKSKHHSMHFSAQRQVAAMQKKESREKANEWYRSDYGREKQGAASRKGWNERKPIERACVICNKKFMTKNLNGTKYCSQVCRSKSQSNRESAETQCLVCGKTFVRRVYAQKWREGKTCSQSCKGSLISRTKMGVINDVIPTTK